MANTTLDRIGDIVRSNVNEFLDRLEDPEKLVRQLLRDMEQAVEQAVESVSRAIAGKGRREREFETNRQRAESYSERARRAFEKGDEELARKALELKVYYNITAEQLRAAAEEGSQAVTQLKSRLAQLRDELKAARDSQGRLIAEIQVAEGSATSLRSDDPRREVERLEAHLEKTRGELERLRVRLQGDDSSEAGDDQKGFNADSLEQRFTDLELREKVEKEMEALRRKGVEEEE
jgi:phage shock protein A